MASKGYSHNIDENKNIIFKYGNYYNHKLKPTNKNQLKFYKEGLKIFEETQYLFSFRHIDDLLDEFILFDYQSKTLDNRLCLLYITTKIFIEILQNLSQIKYYNEMWQVFQNGIIQVYGRHREMMEYFYQKTIKRGRKSKKTIELLFFKWKS